MTSDDVTLQKGDVVSVAFPNGDRLSDAVVVSTMYGFGDEPVTVLYQKALIELFPKLGRCEIRKGDHDGD